MKNNLLKKNWKKVIFWCISIVFFWCEVFLEKIVTYVLYIQLIICLYRIQFSNIKSLNFLFLPMALIQFVLCLQSLENYCSKLRKQIWQLGMHFPSQFFNCGYGNFSWQWTLSRQQNDLKKVFVVHMKVREYLCLIFCENISQVSLM